MKNKGLLLVNQTIMVKNSLCNLSYINGLQNAKEMGKFYCKTNSRLENRRRPFAW